MARSGGRWKDLPERFGKVSTVKQRYFDWIERGVFAEIFQALSGEADMEWLMVDSTIVRAHQHAAGARRQKGGACPGPGPLSRRPKHQIHACTDGLGDPLRLLGGPGQASDIGQAAALIRVERFFSKLKQFRRVATRYDKLLANFMGFVTLATIAILLR